MDDVAKGNLLWKTQWKVLKRHSTPKQSLKRWVYMLPEKKTAYPFWKDGAGEEE